MALPSVDEDWAWAFYSCNGLDKPENKESTHGMEPMWRDVVARHAQRPFHALVGGGQGRCGVRADRAVQYVRTLRRSGMVCRRQHRGSSFKFLSDVDTG